MVNEMTIDSFLHDQKNSLLFIGSGRSLYQFDLKTFTIELLYEDFKRGSILSIESLSNSKLAIGCFQSTIFIFDLLSKTIEKDIYIQERITIEAMHKLNNFLIVGGTSNSLSETYSAFVDLDTCKVHNLDFCKSSLSNIFSDSKNVYLVCGDVSVLNHRLDTFKGILEVPYKSARTLFIHGQDIYVNGGSKNSFTGGWLYKFNIDPISLK